MKVGKQSMEKKGKKSIAGSKKAMGAWREA